MIFNIVAMEENLTARIENVRTVTEHHLHDNPGKPIGYDKLLTPTEEKIQIQRIVEGFCENLKGFGNDYGVKYSEHCSNISKQDPDDKLVKMQENINDMRTQHDQTNGVKVFHNEETNTYIRDSRARPDLKIDTDKERNSPQNNICLAFSAVRAAATAAKIEGYLNEEQYKGFINELSQKLQNFSNNLSDSVENKDYDTKRKYYKDFYKDVLKTCASYGVNLDLVKETNYFLNGTTPLPNTSTIMNIEGKDVVQTSVPITHLSEKQRAIYKHIASLDDKDAREGKIGDKLPKGLTKEDFNFFTLQQPNIRTMIHGHAPLMLDGNHQVQTQLFPYLVGPRNFNIKDDYILEKDKLNCVGERTDLPAIAYTGPGGTEYQIKTTMENIKSAMEAMGGKDVPYVITSFVSPQSITSPKDVKFAKILEAAVNRLQNPKEGEDKYNVKYVNTPYNIQRLTTTNKQEPIEQSAKQYAGVISTILTAEREVAREDQQLVIDKINKYFKDIETKGKASPKTLKEAKEALQTWKEEGADRLKPLFSDIEMAMDLNQRLKGPTDLKLFKSNKVFALRNNNLELSTDFTTLGNSIAGGFKGVGEEVNRVTIESKIMEEANRGIIEDNRGIIIDKIMEEFSIFSEPMQKAIRKDLEDKKFESQNIKGLPERVKNYIDVLAGVDNKKIGQMAKEIDSVKQDSIRSDLRDRNFESDNIKKLPEGTKNDIDLLKKGDRKEISERAREINGKLKEFPQIGTGCASNIDRGGLCILQSFVKNIFKNLQKGLDNIIKTVVDANPNINPQYNTHPGTGGIKSGTTGAALPTGDKRYENTSHIPASGHKMKIKDKDIKAIYKITEKIHKVREELETNFEKIDQDVREGKEKEKHIHAAELCKRQSKLIIKLDKLSRQEEKIQGSSIVGASKDDIEDLKTQTLVKKEAIEQSVRTKEKEGQELDKGEKKILAEAEKKDFWQKLVEVVGGKKATSSGKWEEKIKLEEGGQKINKGGRVK